MYTTVIDEEDFAVKPMNCPGGMLVYKNEPHSYRDLPLRVGELGLVHRHELSAPSTACSGCAASPRTTPHLYDPRPAQGRDQERGQAL